MLNFNQIHRQKGFSLAVVLMLITVMGGFLVGITSNNKGSVRQEAEIAGWELAEISRAARVYSRNQIVSEANLVTSLSPSGAGPRDISIDDLIGASMLPDDFLRQSGGNRQNALGQDIRVILANFPIDGDPLDPTTVPTAYVYAENNNKTNGSIIQDVVQEVRRQGVSVSAPIFNGGANVTGDCDGRGDTAILWDTGCIADADFTTLTGNVFVEGDFVIPTWRAVNFDTRAIMRFPHPESTGLPTMLTALEMGESHDCVANPAQFVNIPSDIHGTVASDICGSLDDSVGVDNRRDIINTSNVETLSVIVDPQATSDTTTDVNGLTGARAEEIYAMNISGSLNATGSAKVYDGDVTIGQNLTADKNIFATNNGAGTPVSASAVSVQTGNATTPIFSVTNTPSVSGDISVQNDFLVSGSGNISGSVVAEQVQMNDASATEITVSDTANMLGTTRVRNVNVDGSAPLGSYDYITGELNATNINFAGDVEIDESLNVLGGATVSHLDITNASGTAECLDDCPKRDLAEFCNNITGMTFDECMIAFQ